MTRGRWMVLVLASGVLIALIPVGRWERQRWLHTQNAGIEALVQSLRPRLTHPHAYRHDGTYACLLYSTKGEPFGKEFCFNPSGHIIEAIDRFPGKDPEIWTVRPEPGAASTEVDPAILAHLLNRLGAQDAPTIQIGLPDRGPE